MENSKIKDGVVSEVRNFRYFAHCKHIGLVDLGGGRTRHIAAGIAVPLPPMHLAKLNCGGATRIDLKRTSCINAH